MNPRLLIADDTEVIRMCLVDFVRSEMGQSVDIVEASDGQEAIDAITSSQREKFAGVLTDFNMPFFDGIQVANAAFGVQVPNVILMTAQNRDHLIRVCGKEVFDELAKKGLKVVHKPFSLDDITREVIDPLRKAS